MQAAAAGTLAGVGCGGGSGAAGAPQELRNARFRARGFVSSGSPLQGRSPRLRRGEERRGEGAPCPARCVHKGQQSRRPELPLRGGCGPLLGSPFPSLDELETVLRPRPRGGEARGPRGRYRCGSVPQSRCRGRTCSLSAGTRLPVLAPRRSLRAPPHPLTPLPASSARPPGARPGRAAAAAAAAAALPALLARAAQLRSAPRPAPFSYPLPPLPPPALASASLPRCASPPAWWPIGGH